MGIMTYIVFCPYFGKLPEYFPLWLLSCKYNNQIDFVIFTDDKAEYDLPPNVKVYRLSFDEFKQLIQRKFDFEIALDNPYKLCDFKATYGYVFEEHITRYAFWGYCDLDMFFGNLQKFIPGEGYEKISHLGHLTLYRNTPEVNRCFMDLSVEAINYKDILGSAMHFGFDEIGVYGVNTLFEKRGYRIHNLETQIADIYPYHRNLSLTTLINETFSVDRQERVFTYEEGGVYGWSYPNGELRKSEYAYIHIQKRNLSCETINEDKFMIRPHSIAKYEVVRIETIREAQEKGPYWIAYKIRVKAACHLLHRWFVIRKIMREKKK